MKNHISDGDVVQVTAPYALTSGNGCLVGTQLFGIAVADYANADTEAQIKTTGVFYVNKTSAQAWTVGAKIYWDNTAKEFTTTSTSNSYVGVAVEAAANPSSFGYVRLNGFIHA